MALYSYIKNDITDSSMKGSAGGGRVRGVGTDWNGGGMGVEWVASLYRDKMSI